MAVGSAAVERVEPVRPWRLETAACVIRRRAAGASGLAVAARRAALARHRPGAGVGVLRGGAGVEFAAALLHDDRAFFVLEYVARSVRAPERIPNAENAEAARKPLCVLCALCVSKTSRTDLSPELDLAAPDHAALGQHASRGDYGPGVDRGRHRLGMAELLVAVESAPRSTGVAALNDHRRDRAGGDFHQPR